MKMEALQVELVNLFIAVLVACTGLLTRKIMEYLKQKGIVTKLETNKELVKIVVDAVEQSYNHLESQGKFNKAKSETMRLLKEKNIKISENEINLIIESIVKEMNETIKRGIKD